MKLASFPGCCTAHVLHNLGGSQLSAGRKSPHTKKDLRDWIQLQVDSYAGRRCFVVMTNDDQTAANSVLKELGFKHSRWMSKQQHPESRLRLWWKEP
jgi:hypothetical protein